MKSFALKDLKPKGFFTKNLFLDRGYVLLAPETAVSQDLVNRLAKWEFRELLTDGASVDSIIESDTAEGGQEESVIVAEGSGDRERLESVRTFIAAYTEFVDGLYSRYVTNSELKYNDLCEKMRQICELLNKNRRFVLRGLSMVEPNKNYLISHAVNCSMFSILLGSALKIPLARLIELGAAAVLHEIGMVKLPPNLFMTTKQLTPEERRRITAHTILGFNILKEQQVPLPVQLASLEHHERMNGSGYPRAMNADQISLYAKIIAVACSYDAVTTARPFRDARESHEGILDLLRNEGKQYDELIIKALVFTLSIYPIGSHVLLTNGKRAVVIDTSPDNPRFPIVQILGASNPDGTDVKVRTTETGARILRSLTKIEIAETQQNG